MQYWSPLLIAVAFLLGSAFAEPGIAAEKDKESVAKTESDQDQEALDKQFQELMSGCVLTGNFSITGQEDKPASKDSYKYTITKVSKLKNDYWLFLVRLQNGDLDLTVPLTLKVFWAGDTAVITLTDLTIPGVGTFTTRLMIYEGLYAGTWQHGKSGGHMWGKVEKISDVEKKGKAGGEAETKKSNGK